MSSSGFENLSDSFDGYGEATSLQFSPPIPIYDKLQSGEYQRKTFAPHKDIDIFSNKLSEDQICERLKRFIEERKENEQSNANKEELNQLFEQFRFQKPTFTKRSGYKPEDIKLRRAEENNYDPDTDPNYESHDEDAFEAAQYFKEMEKQQSKSSFDDKEFNCKPTKQVILPFNNIQDEEPYDDPENYAPTSSSKKVESNPPSKRNSNKNIIKERKNRSSMFHH